MNSLVIGGIVILFLLRGEINGIKALPKGLQYKTHWDYPLGLKWIPRCWTSFNWGLPKQVLGNQTRKSNFYDCPSPIGERGTWQFSIYPRAWYVLPLAWSFSMRTTGGWNFRLGARFDDVDNYCTWPNAARRWYPEGDSDTSTD
jgi:hypothetical protein